MSQKVKKEPAKQDKRKKKCKIMFQMSWREMDGDMLDHEAEDSPDEDEGGTAIRGEAKETRKQKKASVLSEDDEKDGDASWSFGLEVLDSFSFLLK